MMPDAPTPSAQPAEDDPGIRIELNHAPVVSAATLQNRLPLLHRLAVHHEGPDPLPASELHVWTEPAVCAPFVQPIGRDASVR